MDPDANSSVARSEKTCPGISLSKFLFIVSKAIRHKCLCPGLLQKLVKDKRFLGFSVYLF